MVATQEDPCGCTHFPPLLEICCPLRGRRWLWNCYSISLWLDPACCCLGIFGVQNAPRKNPLRPALCCVWQRRGAAKPIPSFAAERVRQEEGSSVEEMETGNPPGPRGVAVSLDPCPRVPLWSPARSDDAVAPPGHCSPSFVPEPYFSPRHRRAMEKLCLLDTTSCGSPGLFVSFLVRSVSCWASGFLFPARPALEHRTCAE